MFDGFYVKQAMDIPVEEEANYQKTEKGILYVPQGKVMQTTGKQFCKMSAGDVIRNYNVALTTTS